MAQASVQARHYLPGGRERGGGIGRLVGYVVDELGDRNIRHEISDTRGPTLTVLGSPFRLFLAGVTLIRDRLFAPRCIQHIHIAGRGSTVRKLMLTGVARLIGSTHILHLHDPEYADDIARRPAPIRFAIKRMFQGADRVVVLGHRDRRLMEEKLDIASDRVAVLHNAVPDPKPTMTYARSPSSPFNILFLGRLSERKGVPELLEALAHPQMLGVDWRATLAGDGPIDHYREQATVLGVVDRIEFPGWVDEPAVRALCARADVLVLPSHAEGMAMSVLEGMANALTVVTTRVGAHEEVLTEDVNGRFVTPGDPEGLAEALAVLSRDPAGCERLARAARDYFLNNLSIAAYADRLQRVYASMEGERRGSARDAAALAVDTSDGRPS
ncbi:MAG: glycosyltransferase family 4 protein [Pseudomonadota bacterium]